MCHMATQDALDIAEVGRRLAARRDALRLDQDAVAERAGLSRAYISRLERGIVPNPKVGDLLQVAKALNMPLAALLGRDASPHELRVTECAQILSQLDDQPPELAETILRWLRESVDLALMSRLGRTN